MRWKDEVTGHEFEFRLIPRDQLKVTNFQRTEVKTHIENLKESIERMGFISALVVFKVNDHYEIIDGQHRFLASELNKYPCIIVPKEYKYRILNFNIEKQDVIFQKAEKMLKVYREIMNITNEMEYEYFMKLEEGSHLVNIYLITIGLACEQKHYFHSGAFEPILKEIDTYLDLDMKTAYSVRKQRASMLVELDNILYNKYQEIKKINKHVEFNDLVKYIKPEEFPNDFIEAMNLLINNAKNIDIKIFLEWFE